MLQNNPYTIFNYPSFINNDNNNNRETDSYKCTRVRNKTGFFKFVIRTYVPEAAVNKSIRAHTI